MVEIVDRDVNRSSVFLREMAGSKLPVVVAHGEGRASFASEDHRKSFESCGLLVFRYVDSQGKLTEKYPFNPNGSSKCITGVQTPGGRVLALMPHPERVTTMESNSWYPKPWKGTGPWSKLFQNARQWIN